MGRTDGRSKPSAPATGRAETAGENGAAPAILVIFLGAMLLPEDLNIRPGGVMLTAARLVLLAGLPQVLFRTARLVTRRGSRTPCDVAVLLLGCWMFLAVWMTDGPNRAAVGAGVTILEICSTYFMFRVFITKRGQVLGVARWLTVLLAANALLATLDVVTHRHVLHDLAQSLTGYHKLWRIDTRNGIVRAQGMQEHPILLGCISAYGGVLAMQVFAGLSRLLLTLCCLVGVGISMSSAPITAMAASFALLAYRAATPGRSGRWRVLIITGAAMFAALLVLHPRPFSFLMDHITLDPETGFYRLLVWNVVGALVLASPVFGLGLDLDFTTLAGISNTVDSVWLDMAATYGIPGSLLLAAVLLTSGSHAAGSRAMTPVNTRLGCALGIIVFQIIYLGFTVDYWGCCWMFLGVLAALRVCLVHVRQPASLARNRLKPVSLNRGRRRLPVPGAMACLAPLLGALPQHPGLLRRYPVRPPWHVAGVDYRVGPRSAPKLDPEKIALPGVSVDAATRVVDVTASHVVLAGYDFSLHGGYRVVVHGDDVRITDSRFVMGSNAGYYEVAGYGDRLALQYSTLDGTADGINQSALIAIYGRDPTIVSNWLLRFGQHALEMNQKLGVRTTLDYSCNLIEDGGTIPGAHMNYLQWGYGTADKPVIAFNTTVQTPQRSGGGEGFQFDGFPGSSITAAMFANNTMITSGPRIAQSYALHLLGNNANTVSPDNSGGVVRDNYFDTSAAFGAIYPVDSAVPWSFANNRDLATGRAVRATLVPRE